MADKFCPSCKEVKSTMLFGVLRKTKDGLNCYCKQCRCDKENSSRLKDVEGYNTKQRERRAENVAAVNERQRKYRADNVNLYKKSARKFYSANRDKVLAACKSYYEATKPDRLAAQKEWKKKNPYAKNASCAKRYASKKNATPPWADSKEINAWYKDAQIFRAAGWDVQVDHIVPLRSNIVCGLHVQDNLQLLSSAKNQLKNNRFWPNMPDESLRG